MTAGHAPVLLEAALSHLAPQDGELFVDGTLGAGGYARAILERADVSVVAFDRDPTAVDAATEWRSAYADRLQIIARPFADMADALAAVGIDAVDGVALDIGVSSMQLDDAARGFSFRFDGPLSMRMDGERPNAADLVNEAEINDLAAIFRVYGEEREAGRMARAVAAARDHARIDTTGRLAAVIEAARPRRASDKIHPATRVFQALRIFVNDELGQLCDGLHAAERLLRPGGRLAVVTFHSLEDRLVKQFLAERTGRVGGGSRHAPAAKRAEPSFEALTRKPVSPSAAEQSANPRARSAKLRAARRTHAPAHPPSELAPRVRLSPGLAVWSRRP